MDWLTSPYLGAQLVADLERLLSPGILVILLQRAGWYWKKEHRALKLDKHKVKFISPLCTSNKSPLCTSSANLQNRNHWDNYVCKVFGRYTKALKRWYLSFLPPSTWSVNLTVSPIILKQTLIDNILSNRVLQIFF